MGCFKIDGFSVKSFNHCTYAAQYEYWEYLLGVVLLRFPNSKTFFNPWHSRRKLPEHVNRIQASCWAVIWRRTLQTCR